MIIGNVKPFELKRKISFIVFVLPGAIFMTLMILMPIASNIVMSFKDVDLFNFANGDSKFVFFQSYKEVIQKGVLAVSIRNTLVFTLACLVFQFPIGFAMAIFFSKNFKGAGSLRGINVVAWMVPMVAVAGVFKYMFNADVGIINHVLLSLRIIKTPVEWLANGSTAMVAVVAANIWKGVPFNMILLATALTTLPRDVYESASIDGATRAQSFVHITIPLLKPAIISVLTLGFIYTFKVFDLVYVMTGGGPGTSTEVLSTLAYRYSFSEFNFSQGAVTANILFVILMIVGLFYIRMVTREEQ
jgi:multiple sugar transport system permease protein